MADTPDPVVEAETVTVTFQPLGSRVETAVDSTVLAAARQAGLILAANCGGNGICGRCRVTLLGEGLPPPTDTEQDALSPGQIEAGQRLACRSRLTGDVGVHVPRITMGNQQRLQLDGRSYSTKVDARVRCHRISGFPATDTSRTRQLGPHPTPDGLDDFERLAQLLSSESSDTAHWWATTNTRSALRRVADKSDWQFTAFTRDDEVIGFSAAGNAVLGVAVDVGCTKIAAYLLDLETGEQIGASGIVNPQISYGEDLISRLTYAAAGPVQAQELAQCVRDAIKTLIATMADCAAVRLDQIADLCLVGNTAMTQLLLGLPVDSLRSAPFIADTRAMDVRACEVGFGLPNNAYLHVLPGVGAFVGADHVAVILANGLHACGHTAMGIDIGTNTELVLSKPDHGLLLVASSPAGPIFEGGHIRHGMRAAPGAIERIEETIDGIQPRTIGNQLPIGLCGSGVVDAIALLWAQGTINHRGHLQIEAPGVRRGDSGNEYVLVAAADTGHGRDIVITQQDVSEVQLAKAAIAASITTLLAQSTTDPKEVQEVVLAGAFGSFLNVASCTAIGLLPDLPNATYVQAGNSAGTGAKMALVSVAARQEAAEIARRGVNVGLTNQPGFNRQLALATRFQREETC